MKNGGRVIYIDTEGGFSTQRMSQLTPDIGQVLGKMQLIEPKDFKEQGDIIRSLEKKGADLIVLDSAAALYRLEYADPD